MAGRKTTKKGRGAKATRKGKAKSAPARKAGARGRGSKAAKTTARKAVRRPAKKSSRKPAVAKRAKLYTLTEVGKMASVSMPTLQKYKKLYADRIPSVGEGRRQRYPKSAVAVLRQLKKENLAKRGRPPKKGGARAASKSAGRRARPSNLLTLTEISRRTGISYPTVSRYVKLFLDRIPHEGSGRARRFPKQAVEVFRQLRRESRPGRPKGSAKTASPASRRSSGAGLDGRLRKLERTQADLSKQLATLVKLLKRPTLQCIIMYSVVTITWSSPPVVILLPYSV